MVEAPAGVERVLDLAAEDRLHRPDRATRDGRRGLVHAEEWRIVATFPDPGRSPTERLPGEPLHDLQVARAMAPAELVIGRRLRGKARLGADRAEQVDPGPNRRGVSGWPGPKSYDVERGP